MLHYHYETFDERREGFYFDQIEINTNQEIEELRKLLPENELSQEASKFSIRKASKNAQKVGFKSRIKVVAPSHKCLEILSMYLSDIAIVKFSDLEIARDTFYNTEREAEYESNKLLQTLRMKYNSEYFIYDQFFEKRKITFKKDLFAERTGYYGSKDFKYVIYARLSKINGQPCVHCEWRVKGAIKIENKTGITCINDLMTFNFVKFFEKMELRYIIHERIDTYKLGRWILGWGNKKKLTEREKRKLQLMTLTFQNCKAIYIYADLVRYLTKRKAALKKKRGPKTRMEKKFLSLKDYGLFSKRAA
jgi:hypothetical protein